MSGHIIKQRCPKCGGNLFLDNDDMGWYEQCLQCSFIRYLDVVYENGSKVVCKTASPTAQSELSRRK